MKTLQRFKITGGEIFGGGLSLLDAVSEDVISWEPRLSQQRAITFALIYCFRELGYY